MNWDATQYIKSENDPPAEQKPASGGGNWLAENVWNPMVNGSGILQQYNNFTDKNIAPLKQAEASLGSPEWAVQTLAGVGGAIVPYVIAGKLTGKLFGAVAERAGARGAVARVATNPGVHNVLGAGIYDFAKEPLPGETRFGTAAGSMAGFSVFEVGNAFIRGKSGTMFDSLAKRTAGRFAVGTTGGLTTFETSQTIDGMLGASDDRSWRLRFESAVSGGFLNVALPAVHSGMTRAIDNGYNARSYGPGVPIQRYMQYKGVNDVAVLQSATWNPLARVKTAADGVVHADVQKNVIYVPENANPGKLAHELRHLRVAREMEPHYKSAIDTAKADPAQADAAAEQFYNMRHYAEYQARFMEGLVDSKTTPGALTKLVENAAGIPEQRAANGKTYRENWQAEWAEMQRDPNSRPRFEYEGETTPAEAAPKDGAVIEKGKDKTSARDTSRDIRVTDAASLGVPEPLGATVSDKGINFSVFSKNATNVELLLFNDIQATQPTQTLPLNRTGDVWHRFVDGAPDGTLYLYRAHGPYDPAVNGTRFNGKMALLDPYAKAITGDSNRPVAYDNANPSDPNRHLRPGNVDSVKDMPKGVAVKMGDFDWQGTRPPNTPMTDTVIYEVNVKGFTGGAPELGNLRGTYRGLVEKIPYLKKLGVTAVELMPVHQFEKIDNFNGQMTGKPVNPETGEPLRNQWGYQTIGYNAPEASYAADGVRGQQVKEFKYMVREMHKNGIEVILDVVYNHTAEDAQLGPTLSFRGLDNPTYYHLKQGAPDQYVDHTGVRNTLNTNEPAVQKMIMDSLRYWVKEMQVDGFRFDLATIFNYDKNNVEAHRTSILEAMERDPDLANVKLIAEPWSIDQYKVGNFAPTRWAEWNGVFRDTVRKFLKSDSGVLSDLAERITGSRRWFDAQKGRHSINFVTAHDGFTLNDLFSYNRKYNIGNGEGNRDGANDNYNWNHGVEGPVERANIPEAQRVAIEQLRNRQVKNAMAMLMLSQGTPMILSGDEIRRTTNGNNNYWPQEKLNQIDWSLMEKHPDTVRFLEMMTGLRKEFQIGRRAPEDYMWHGTKPFDQSFQQDGRFIAWQLPATEGQPKSLYSAFNAYWEPLQVTLPEGKWRRRIDTNLPQGQDIVGAGEGPVIDGGTYVVQPRTGVVFESANDPAK